MILLNTLLILDAFNRKSTKYKQITYIAQIHYLLFNMYKKYNLYLYINNFHYYSIVLSHS